MEAKAVKTEPPWFDRQPPDFSIDLVKTEVHFDADESYRPSPCDAYLLAAAYLPPGTSLLKQEPRANLPHQGFVEVNVDHLPPAESSQPPAVDPLQFSSIETPPLLYYNDVMPESIKKRGPHGPRCGPTPDDFTRWIRDEGAPLEGPSLKVKSVEVRDNVSEGTHECPKCGKRLRSLYELQWHRSLEDPRVYACSKCDLRFGAASELDEHRAKSHAPKDHAPKRVRAVYPCNQCDARFIRVASLRVHRMCHVVAIRYPCKICAQVYKDETALRAHEKTHAKPLNHPCAKCKRRFAHVGDLAAHVQHEHKTRRSRTSNRTKEGGNHAHACATCNMAFVDRAELIAHGRQHSGRRPYSCKDCTERFVQYSDLALHRKTHKP